jgi:hypothetical protein
MRPKSTANLVTSAVSGATTGAAVDVSDFTGNVTMSISLGAAGTPAGAVVTNNQATTVKNGAGTSAAATLAVTGTTLTQVNIAPNTTILGNGVPVSIRNNAGAGVHSGTSVVAANGSLTGVNLDATTSVILDNGPITAPVTNSGGTNPVNGCTAVVANNNITAIHLPVTAVAVLNTGTIPVQNFAGSAVAGTHVASVSGGSLTNVKLATTVAPISSGFALTGVTPTGTFATTVTFTVLGGVITAIALS